MKRIGYLWQSVTSFDNLLLAYYKARKAKRSRQDVALFSLNLERELLQLQQGLQQQKYCPGEYRQFTIYERKPRLISSAPFRDRVVHHALMNVIEPLLDKRFIDQTYACRKGKGVHQAVSYYQRYAKQYSYVLKLDISRYFPSIDHAILKQQIRRHIKDAKVLALFDLIIDHTPVYEADHLVYFPGDDLLTPFERRTSLPIGNLTSQFLANLYLNQLDHQIKEKLRVPVYLRYVDDLFLLANSKQQLWDWKNQLSDLLAELRLQLHPRKVNLFHTRLGVDVLGYRVYPDYRLLRNDNGFRFKRNLVKFAASYAKSELTWDEINPRVQSWLGHACQADTYGLRKALFYDVIFRRESGR